MQDTAPVVPDQLQARNDAIKDILLDQIMDHVFAVKELLIILRGEHRDPDIVLWTKAEERMKIAGSYMAQLRKMCEN